MNQIKFDQMIKTGEFEKMFNENKINELLNGGDLTKKQIDALVKLGQKMSKEELQRRQNELAAQPGYKEHILTPLVAKVIAQQNRVRDPKTGRYMKKDASKDPVTQQPVVDEPPKPSKETEQTAEKVGSTLKKTKKKKEKVEETTSESVNENKNVKKKNLSALLQFSAEIGLNLIILLITRSFNTKSVGTNRTGDPHDRIKYIYCFKFIA
jgi:hypothetical protein